MAAAAHGIKQADLESFSAHLKSSKRILALCGAGLSASSGLPTFRGAGGFWRKHDATQLATPGAFESNPSLVWQFYSYRRHMALNVEPNAAHFALAELGRKKDGFLTLTQNVDGLSPRAGHDADKIKYLHGSLFDVKCSSMHCDYEDPSNFIDPIVPTLAIPTEGGPALPENPTSPIEAAKISLAEKLNGTPKELDISDAAVRLAHIPTNELPLCPRCESLLRPGVVWFGEQLPGKVLNDVDAFVDSSEGIDLMIVIGTSAAVWPAAGYIHQAKAKGARVAVINMDPDTGRELHDDDWFFEGDASKVIPELFRCEIGELEIHNRQDDSVTPLAR